MSKDFFDKQGDQFDDHISNSIPAYSLMMAQVKYLTECFAQGSLWVIDYGCSTGKFLKSLNVDCRRLGIDVSDIIGKNDSNQGLYFIQADLFDVKDYKASVSTSIFLLQFLPKWQRVEALKHMRSQLVDGGRLILAEKVYFNDREIQRGMDAWHRQFKRNAFSDTEILDKDDFVAKEMPIATKEQLEDELRQAGFSESEVVFSCTGFQCIVLTK